MFAWDISPTNTIGNNGASSAGMGVDLGNGNEDAVVVTAAASSAVGKGVTSSPNGFHPRDECHSRRRTYDTGESDWEETRRKRRRKFLDAYGTYLD